MDVLEKAGDLFYKVTDSLLHILHGRRTVTLYISNGTGETLSLSSAPTGDKFTTSFNQLEPGHAGYVRSVANGDSGGTVKFTVGGETLICQVTNPRVGKVTFNLSFEEHEDGNGQMEAVLIEPESTMALGRSLPSDLKSTAKYASWGKKYACFVCDVITGSDFAACVRIGTCDNISLMETKAGNQEVSLSGLYTLHRKYAPQQLGFCEWCRDHSRESLGQALFLMEVYAVQAGLGGLVAWDQAFMLTLLIIGFIDNGVLAGLDLQAELQIWRSKTPGHLRDLTVYSSYRPSARHKWSAEDVEAWEDFVSAALVLLETAALQCGKALANSMDSWANAGAKKAFTSGVAAKQKTISAGENVLSLSEHVKARKRANEEEANKKAAPEDIQLELNAEDTLESTMMTLVRSCITESATLTIRCRSIFKAFLQDLTSRQEAQVALQRYLDWVPASQRTFESEHSTGGVLPTKGGRRCGCCKRKKRKSVTHERGSNSRTFFHSLGSEVFVNLDGNPDECAKQLLESLGTKAPPYQILSTNSKSGECFFFSNDSRFLVKTITEAEGDVFFGMLPAYQWHKRKHRESLIVRYDALFCVRDPESQTPIYISVMSSVFDSSYKIHHTFDLKGSLQGRKKKEKEKVSKDQDWLDGGWRLHLPDDVRREFCAVHEEDSAFLMSFGVMDYSVLLGIHQRDLAETTECEHRSTCVRAIPDLGGQNLYFAGIIDFFIGYGLKKEGEHLVRIAQGHGEDASCVDPESYARRAVEFLRTHMVGNGSKDFVRDTRGTFGELRIEVNAAQSLKNKDGLFSVSDPYVTVCLGLQSVRTPTIGNNLNPEWNFVSSLPIDAGHLAQDVILEVWDEDSNKKMQGSDDFLGRTSAPLQEVISALGPIASVPSERSNVVESSDPKSKVERGKLKVPEVLQDVSTGRLHAELRVVGIATTSM